MKSLSDAIGNRSRNLPVGSEVPQLTALPRILGFVENKDYIVIDSYDVIFKTNLAIKWF
jgi:hypothetical protein